MGKLTYKKIHIKNFKLNTHNMTLGFVSCVENDVMVHWEYQQPFKHFFNVNFFSSKKQILYTSGFQGQMVAIFPSHDLVIVRMGLKEDPEFDFNGLLSGVVSSLTAKSTK